MSLATRCTHCGTIFKVVQDQLKVSEGWVRCGRCHEVFNALPSLFDLDKDPPPPRVTPPASPEPASAPPPQPALVAPPEPPEPAQPDADSSAIDALVKQGLLDHTEVNPDLDSQVPGAWAATQPTGLIEPDDNLARLDDSNLALDPAPIESATDFELDTAIAVDDNTPLEDVLAAMAPRQAPRPAPQTPPAQAAATPGPTTASITTPNQAAGTELPLRQDLASQVTHTPSPWLEAPPDDVPSTDEEDALDSRYLMPTPRERKAPRRRGRGPEFADAQFPSDAMEDAQDDWASDFGPSALEPEPAPMPPPSAAPAEQAQAQAPDEPERVDEDALSTQPSRFGDEFSPEQAAPPPSERPGRPGTRGRDPAQEAPEFVRRAQRKAFWRHPATRSVLSVMCLGLALSLGLQLMHHFRDLLAAHHPETRPVLKPWCELVGCQLAPPLRLQDLQVESATLVRATSAGADHYRLAVVVHNQARIDLAWPHVDLTLTDAQGSVIARRVFAPTDAQWLDTPDPKADAPAGSAQPAMTSASTPTAAPHQRSTTLLWHLQAPGVQAAGYTAELFYP